MALDKAIAAGKEHRKQYNDSRAFDRTCRCNGSCDWCRNNRLYSTLRKIEKMNQEVREYEKFYGCGI